MVELRLFKASLSSPDERSNSSDAVTVREMGDPKTSTDVSPIVNDASGSGDALASDDSVDAAAAKHHQHQMPAIMSKSVSPRHYAATAAYLDKMSAHQHQLQQQPHSEMQSSFADSGHFEDITTSSVNSRDSYVQTSSGAIGGAGGGSAAAGGIVSATGSTGSLLTGAEMYERSDLIRFYELKIEDLIKNHSDESQEVRVTHNDRVEALLERLAESNARYSDLVPDHDQAKERIRELERQLEELQQKLQEQENKQNKMYLHMFAKGQEAERIEHADKVRKGEREREKGERFPYFHYKIWFVPAPRCWSWRLMRP